MIARGFKSVIWVGAVGAAAIACYMVSLQVATERADLTRVELQIIAAKRDIRTLQTELGTRGRMSQLETWNAEVLALSAPTASQFLPDQVTLARFDQPAMTLEERSAQVRMASAETAPEAPAVPVPVIRAAAPAAAASPQPMVRQASFTPDLPRAAAVAEKKPEAKAAPKPKIEQAKADKPAAAKALASKSEAKPTPPAPAKKADAKTAAKIPAKAPVKAAAKAPAEKPRLAKADEVKGASRKPQGSGGN
ncbi:MAG TPA: hypothetical protein VGB65_14550 [Allosphingosinicella sp.]|jgi:hypothetical protein